MATIGNYPARKTAQALRRYFRSVRGTQAGFKTYTASFNAELAALENKARAWEAMSRALDANADGESHSSAADVCGVGFYLQERLAAGERI